MVIIPTADPNTVKESSNPATQAKGVKLAGAGSGTVAYQVGSGDYHFTSQITPISASWTSNGVAQAEPDIPHVTSTDIDVVDPAFWIWL